MKAAASALDDARPRFKWRHADTASALAKELAAELKPGAILMLKASRSMKLEVLLEPLSIKPCSTT
jgi:UDP-N-acetylmuramyl pentapeptide synthase